MAKRDWEAELDEDMDAWNREADRVYALDIPTKEARRRMDEFAEEQRKARFHRFVIEEGL